MVDLDASLAFFAQSTGHNLYIIFNRESFIIDFEDSYINKMLNITLKYDLTNCLAKCMIIVLAN